MFVTIFTMLHPANSVNRPFTVRSHGCHCRFTGTIVQLKYKGGLSRYTRNGNIGQYTLFQAPRQSGQRGIEKARATI